jgi:putative ABC transport system permease protein
MIAFFRRIQWWLQRRRKEDELHEELAFHLSEELEERQASAPSNEQPHSATHRDLGNVALIVEDTRVMWTWPGLARIGQDLRFSLRTLRRSPGFTVVGVLTLGIAVGAATAMYGVVDGVVLRPLPYPRSEQLVQLRQVNQSGTPGPFSDPNFDDLRAAASSFASMAEYNFAAASVVAGTVPVRVIVGSVSRDFFDVFGVVPSQGRRFVSEELREGGAGVAVVSSQFWRQHFGEVREPSLAKLRVNGQPHTIVGIMPAGFVFPATVDIWTPREQRPRNPYRTGHNWPVVARIKDDLTINAARAEATAVAQRLKQEYGDGTAMTDVAVIPLRDQIVGQVRPVLWLLLSSLVLLMGIACANLATLFLARISTRRRELAVRTALGARGTWLLLPVVAEPMIVAMLGGLVGIFITVAAMQLVRLMNPADLPRLTEIRMSWSVLVFAILATGLTALVFGVLAAWQTRRLEIADALKDSARGHTGGTTVRRLRHGLVIAQLALSLVLLVGAGLLGRSFAELLRQDSGFRREGLLTITLSNLTPQIRIVSGALEVADPTRLPRQAQLNEQLLERLRAFPGAVEAGGVNVLPMAGRDGSSGTFLIVRSDDRQAQEAKTLRDLGAFLTDKSRTGNAAFRVASAGYFRAMGIPLVRGRLFENTDGPDAPHVALISESLARSRWPNEDPIGLRIQFGGMDGDMRVFTVVGIVGDIREGSLHTEPTPTLYAEYRQRPLSTFDFTFVIQATVPPTSLIADARRVIQEISPDTAPRFLAIDEVVATSVAGRRFTLGLTAAFAAAALLVAVLGVYGVLSYLVTQRSHEFGVRIALGARWADIERLVLREAGRLIVLGLAIGTILTFAAKRVLEGMLFGIRSTDPATYISMGALLALVALLACQLPAIRAARVDPVRTLRAD